MKTEFLLPKVSFHTGLTTKELKDWVAIFAEAHSKPTLGGRRSETSTDLLICFGLSNSAIQVPFLFSVIRVISVIGGQFPFLAQVTFSPLRLSVSAPLR
jgi:hypothetical protein